MTGVNFNQLVVFGIYVNDDVIELAKCAGQLAGCPFSDVVSFGYADEGSTCR